MEKFKERYLGHEKDKPEAVHKAELKAMKRRKEMDFLDSRGMPRWMARIAFFGKLQVFWMSEDPNFQLT